MNKLVFKLNPYDRCVSNKIIGGRKCTIIWHVDYLNILHVEYKVVDDIIEVLDKEYVQDPETPMTVQSGKMHDYLGMDMN